MQVAAPGLKTCALSLAAILAPPLDAGEMPAFPVLWETPGCEHARLGTVSADIGTKVNEGTQDGRVPVVRVEPALRKLVRAAAAAGGNAVVLRSHQGVYFTYNGRRSSAPVYINLRGGAVRLPDGGLRCELVLAHADELERRMLDGTPVKVTAEQAWSED